VSVNDDRDQKVAAYVAAHPGCTSRDVARDVLEGNGFRYDSTRTLANASLNRCLAAKTVRRQLVGASIFTWWSTTAVEGAPAVEQPKAQEPEIAPAPVVDDDELVLAILRAHREGARL
jgi:hypothetical protein